MADSSWTGSGVYNPAQHSSTNESATPVDSQKGSANVTAANSQPVTDSPITGPEEQRILNRHIVSSASRGTQTTTGQNIINDPATANPVMVTSGITQNTTFSDPITQTPRIIEGLLPDSTYGMWVSKPGIDVTTATISDLVFNSNQDTFKIIKKDTITVTTTGGTVAYAQVPHGLNFTPIVLGFLNNATITFSGNTIISGGSIPLPTWGNVAFDLTTPTLDFSVWYQILSDNTNVVAMILNSAGVTRTETFTYYLLQESAQTNV